MLQDLPCMLVQLDHSKVHFLGRQATQTNNPTMLPWGVRGAAPTPLVNLLPQTVMLCPIKACWIQCLLLMGLAQMPRAQLGTLISKAKCHLGRTLMLHLGMWHKVRVRHGSFAHIRLVDLWL